MFYKLKTEHQPYISFAFAVLNEEKNIERCLTSIRMQNYPQEKIEIIIADGGSIDRTVELAKKYNVRIINNPKKLAEPGCALAHSKAKGDLKVFFAADNTLPDDQWINRMIRPFLEDKEIVGAFTHIAIDSNDFTLNKYYSELQVDPLSWFIYGDTSNPLEFETKYSVISKGENWSAYKFNMQKHPLIAFAQGFIIKSTYSRPPELEGDDILPVLELISKGEKIAYVKNAGVYHYHLESFSQFSKKFYKRILNNLEEPDYGINRRSKFLSPIRKIRKYLFLIYGITIFPPLIHSIFWRISSKKTYFYWHSICSISLAYIIIYCIFKKKIKAVI